MSGPFGDKEFVKNRGHWVKVGKNGGLLVKASEKSRVFLVAHGVQPKVECPPPPE